MNGAILHTVVLYGGVLITLVPTTLTLKRSASHYELRDVLWAVWPFALLAVLEALQLRTGRLIAPIAVPCLAMLAALVFSRSDRVIRWSRRILVALAFGLWLHGGFLLADGYRTRPFVSILGEQVEPRWYTPLTGLEPVVRTKRLPGR